jgi:tetratricopeptide (TPR) repeat protein
MKREMHLEPGILPENPTLSVCMIVRDEEKMLSQCLKSIQDVSDELIVVDTGCTDNTISIAKDFGAKVFHFKWCDDFAAARNESLKHATGDWIFQIDADEELLASSIAPLKEAMSNSSCLAYVIICDNGATCRAERFVEVGRLFRNHPFVQYSRPYHEMVAPSVYNLIARDPSWQLLYDRKIIIRHHGYEPSEMESRKKHERGLRIMESYVAEHQSDDYMLTKLAETYNAVKRHDEAAANFKKALTANPKNSDARKGLGIACLERGMFDKAIVELNKAVGMNPKCADSHNNLGLAYWAKGLLNRAISEYTEALTLEPDFGEAHYNLAMAYGASGLVDDEISEYKKALDINPDLAEAHSNLGAAYVDKGMLDEAIVEYTKALAINPRLVDAQVNLGMSYRQKGMPDNAIAVFEKAIAIDQGNGEAYFQLAAIYYSQRQYKLAVQHCNKAVELGCQVPPWFLQRMNTHS